MNIRIHGAEPDDMNAVLKLMRRLAEHEGLAQHLALTSESLHRICFDPPKRVEMIVAELIFSSTISTSPTPHVAAASGHS